MPKCERRAPDLEEVLAGLLAEPHRLDALANVSSLAEVLEDEASGVDLLDLSTTLTHANGALLDHVVR